MSAQVGLFAPTLEVVRSLEYDQLRIIASIRRLHLGGAMFEVDASFGNGGFWPDVEPPLCFDVEPLRPHVRQASSTALPLGDATVSSIMFDPPFLTYIRSGRDGNGGMRLAKRFAGYWTYDELAGHYRGSLHEFGRVLRRGGVLTFKCQDIVHNHKLHATHVNVIAWAEAEGFRLLDLYVLAATHRLPAPNRKGAQKHARIFHSYFLVFEKVKR